MPALHNDVFDNGLNAIDTNCDALHILKADPGIIWADIATHTLGNKATPAIAAPSDRTGGGREIIVSAISDGSVTGTNTATHFALVDAGNTKVLASGPLDSSQAVTSGNTFTLTELTIGIPDPA